MKKLKQKVQLISLKSYCPRAKQFDMRDILHETVQREDIINHPYKPIEIPKDMKYPTSTKLVDASLYAFVKSILP